MMIPEPLRALAYGVALCFGGVTALSITSSMAIGAFCYANDLKRNGLPCSACRRKGYYKCKLCKGNATIKWSPLYDPIAINPCLCPSCDGNRVQHCLNCLARDIVVVLLKF